MKPYPRAIITKYLLGICFFWELDTDFAALDGRAQLHLWSGELGTGVWKTTMARSVFKVGGFKGNFLLIYNILRVLCLF